MRQERILSSLYDMALVIGAEDRLQPLLDNTLNRLVYHTGYSAGLLLLSDNNDVGESSPGYRLASAIGDHRLLQYLGRPLQLPPPLTGEGPEQMTLEPSQLETLPLRQNHYCCLLRLTIPGEGLILLLRANSPDPGVPLSTIFQPIMANLAKAMQFCRNNESSTLALINDRDQALLANERFRSALDTSNDCIFIINPETMQFLDFNNTAVEVLGYSREELTTMGPQDIKPDYSREMLQASFYSLIENQTDSGILDTVHQRRDGSVFPVEIRLSVLRQDEKKPLIIAVVRDVTERKHAEARLFEEKERAQVTLKSIGDGVITTDPQGKIQFINPIAEQLTEWNTVEARDKPLAEVFHIINENTREPARNPVERCLQENRIVGLSNHTILISRSGNEIAIEDSAAPIRDSHGTIIGVVLVFHDVSEARELTNELSWNASHDPLTELINRREFEHRLEQAYHSSRKNSQTHTLLYIDLDQFKVVNDTSGHIAGDQLLRQLSSRLKQVVRDSDTLARLGGDEFGLLLNNCDLAHAQEIAATLQQTVSEFSFVWDEKTFRVGASIGIVEINPLVEGPTQLMSHADVACYAAKDYGGNRIHVYQHDDNDLAQRQSEMQWVSRINHALENDRLVLFAQPIVSIAGADKQLHFELLLRMLGDDGEIIAPGSFIPAAERYKLMYQLDRWVIDTAMVFFKQHRDLLGDTMLSINLSGFSMMQASLLNHIREAFASNGVPHQNFCFEVTETAAISNLVHAQNLITELRALGCSFALDDFGSGLSSFNYLKNLAVDYLKIDGSFVKDILDDPIDASMVEAINNIGHKLGLKTVAEFVENDAILQKLRALGVDYSQGYATGRPLPLEEIYTSISSSGRAMMMASSRPALEG